MKNPKDWKYKGLIVSFLGGLIGLIADTHTQIAMIIFLLIVIIHNSANKK